MKRSTLIEVVAWVVCLAGMITVARTATAEEGPWKVVVSSNTEFMDSAGERGKFLAMVTSDGEHIWHETGCDIDYRSACDDLVEALNAAHARRMERVQFHDLEPVIRIPPPPCQTGDQGCDEGKP